MYRVLPKRSNRPHEGDKASRFKTIAGQASWGVIEPSPSGVTFMPPENVSGRNLIVPDQGLHRVDTSEPFGIPVMRVRFIPSCRPYLSFRTRPYSAHPLCAHSGHPAALAGAREADIPLRAVGGPDWWEAADLVAPRMSNAQPCSDITRQAWPRSRPRCSSTWRPGKQPLHA
jgi:hypothetical protein